MAELQVKREGVTPNLLKYSVLADFTGGALVLSYETLLKDTVKGPLRSYIERGTRLHGPEAACKYLLCNPSMRAFVTPRSFPRVAVDGVIDSITHNVALKIIAEPYASAIIALEFRHTLAA